MNQLEKVQALIDSQTKENNYIALSCMIEVLGFNFNDAFAKLKIFEVTPYCHFKMEIADITIFYDIKYTATVDFPSRWAYLHRNVFLNDKNLEGFYHSVYLHEYDLEEDDIIEVTLAKDLKLVTPIIQKLFEQITNKDAL